MIESYDDASEIFATARIPVNGKPLDYRTRLCKFGFEFEVRVRGRTIATIKPDNTMHVVFHPLLGGLAYWKWLGVRVYSNKRQWYAHHYRQSRANNHPRCTPGQAMVFRMDTGEHLNPLPPLVRTQVQDVASEWKRKLTEFRRILKVRAKMGGYDELLERFAPALGMSPHAWREINFPASRPLDATNLKMWIETGDYDGLVTSLFYRGGFYAWDVRDHEPHDRIVFLFDRFYNRERDEIRKLVGCYVEEAQAA